MEDGQQIHSNQMCDDGSPRKQLTDTNDAATRLPQHKEAGCTRTSKEITKLVVLCAIIVSVWIVLAIPTVLFYMTKVHACVLYSYRHSYRHLLYCIEKFFCWTGNIFIILI